METISIMIAGLGGASLGSELVKSLVRAGRYRIFGCDISPFAYGHYQAGVEKSFIVEREDYAAAVRTLCFEVGAEAVIPGGEEPLHLIAAASQSFDTANIVVAANSPKITSMCSDKAATFRHLAQLGFRIPTTITVTPDSRRDRLDIPIPCVVKPAVGSGGSVLTFLCESVAEANLYLDYILQNRPVALVQEYLPEDGGEFTVGVLNFPDATPACSVALRRLLQSRLSVSQRTSQGVISSGYSQGRIEDFGSIRTQAENIARALGSCGPLNIQGRVRGDHLYPFEINPRFSASTYLRALAGFNEVDIYLRFALRGEKMSGGPLISGDYLRSLTETFVPLGASR